MYFFGLLSNRNRAEGQGCQAYRGHSKDDVAP
jgi:hypothetical protein